MTEDIWNTVCPVCGSPIPHDMALMELSHVSEGHQHQHHEQPGIRICSTACAKIAEKSPEQYRAAAAMNSVAAGGKRSPEDP